MGWHMSLGFPLEFGPEKPCTCEISLGDKHPMANIIISGEYLGTQPRIWRHVQNH